MNLVLLKQAGAIALVAMNAALLIWTLVTHRTRRVLPAGYYRLLPFSSGVAAFQVAMGLFFLAQGRQVHLMHLFYGTLVATGAILQALMRPTTATGQKYRGKPLIHAALALFVALLAARSWMSG